MDGLTAAQPVEVAVTFRQFRLDLTSKPESKVLMERLVRDGQVKTVQRLQDLHRARTITL